MTLDVAGRGREGSGRTGRAHPAERGRSIRAVLLPLSSG
jgi:hypothetical protein